MKDFLGQDYGPGDKVLYAARSGRSVTMVLAEVVNIRKVYQHQETYKWTDLGLDEEAPFRTRWNRETRQDEPTEERVDVEYRVILQPLNSSRWQQHNNPKIYTDKRTGKTIKDPYSEEHWLGHVGNHFKDHVEVTELPPRPVTITVTENIVLWRRKGEAETSG